jgi:hypothetical protein
MTVAITRSRSAATLAKHVIGQHHEPQRRVALCLVLGVIVETATPVDDQDPGPFVRRRVDPR